MSSESTSHGHTDRETTTAERARYLDRTTDLTETQARCVAHAERGLTESGIAEAVGLTESTVSSHLDAVADTYGPEAVYAKPAGERGDLVPLGEQPPTRPADGPRGGRHVVVESDTGRAPGPNIVERYFRTWTQRGRVHRDAKVAFVQSEFDDQVNTRLSNLSWDAHHATYNTDYEFVSDHRADGAGAWTFDADTRTLEAVREAGAFVPDRDELPLVGETYAVRQEHTAAGTCPECGAGSLTSARDLQAYPSVSGPGVEIVEESETVTHLCLDCRRLFVMVADVPMHDDADDGHHDGNILSEVMK
jgi:DNA-binding CsgD family transcriptional regulator